MVRGNRVLLSLLIRNVLDNALRYTPPGGFVRLSLECQDKTIVLTISDSGPGIPEALRRRVFDRFVRVSGQREDGSGLGLSIVRRIADLHGTDVRLAANAEDPGAPGATFEARFPAAG